MSQDNNNNNSDPLLLNHEYDGIRELDYPLPAWWLATFLGAIIFAAIYWMHYELSAAGPTLSQELAMDMEKINQMRQQAAADAPAVTEDALAALAVDPQALETGKAEFMAKCAACHANDGGGLIGPNLTDSYWIDTEGELVGMYNVINNGVLEKGMPPWKGIIPDDSIKAVVGYVASLHGSKPANPKEPQGELYE